MVVRTLVSLPMLPAKMFKSMAKSFTVFGAKKTVKSLKVFGGVAKMLKGGIQGKLLGMLSGFLDLLKIFDPIFKPISAMIKVFVNEILIQLMPLMMPIMDFLIQLIPWVRLGGKVTGEFIKYLISFVVPTIMLLWNGFLGLIKVMQPFIDVVIGGIITSFNYIKGLYDLTLGVIFELIAWGFKLVSGGYDNTLGAVWDLILIGFNFVKDGIKLVLNGIIGFINGFIDLINLIPGVNIGGLGYLHSGTRSVRETGMYMLKRDERVETPDNTEQQSIININIDMRGSVVDDRDKLVRDISEEVFLAIG